MSVLWWAPPWLNHINSCILDKLYEQDVKAIGWNTEKMVKAIVESNLRKPAYLLYLPSTAFSK